MVPWAYINQPSKTHLDVAVWSLGPLRTGLIIRQKRSIASGESWKYSTGKTVFTRSAKTPLKMNRFG